MMPVERGRENSVNGVFVTVPVAVAMNNKRALLQYPAAAADAVILLVVVLMMVAGLMRIVNVRKEL